MSHYADALQILVVQNEVNLIDFFLSCRLNVKHSGVNCKSHMLLVCCRICFHEVLRKVIMSLNLIGKKKGMTHVFDDKGNVVVCTIIWAEPNVVVQIKSKEKDAYVALQIGACKVSESKKKGIKKPLLGHFSRAQVEPRRYLVESRIENSEGYRVGQEIGVKYFVDCQYVDVSGVSKGKGFQGVMKRHGFSGGPKSHGSKFHRSAGSTGMCSFPGRDFPGGKKAGQMGCKRVTVENLQIVHIDDERQVMLVRGGVPGSNNGLVYIRKSTKKRCVQK